MDLSLVSRELLGRMFIRLFTLFVPNQNRNTEGEDG